MHNLLHFANSIISTMGTTSSRLFLAPGKPTNEQSSSIPLNETSDESSSLTNVLNLDNSIDSWISETKRILLTGSIDSNQAGTPNLPSWLLQDLLDETDEDSGFHFEVLPSDKSEDFL